MVRVILILLFAVPVAAGDAVDAAVQQLIERKAISGAVTLIEHKGKIVHYSAHGEAAPGVPMKKDAVFRIYSMTKPITAVAALLLVEEKKLELDAPVAKYLPAFKDLKVNGGEAPKRAMTLRDLFCHTSGLIYGWERTDVGRLYTRSGVRRSNTLTDLIEKLGRIPLAHQPGSKWHYSISSDVLGAVVEVVAKQPLDEFFRERIFKPLEMTDTGFFVRAKDRFTANYGRGLRVIDAPGKSKFLAKPTNFSGGGGLVSTTNDYLKFCRMLLRGGKPLLSRETVAEMTRNQLAKELVPIRVGGAPLPGTGFGLGVAVRLTDAIPDAVGEFSWGGAASTNFSVVPKRELIIITMAQRMPMTPFLFFAVRPLAYRMTEVKAK
ncbi:MAG: serine hydrolase domain-containing protein [Planctomycetota bacterium]|jgi:CubicO group peptidase (beta-lactamase class C family)